VCQMFKLICVCVFAGFKRAFPWLFRGPLGLSSYVLARILGRISEEIEEIEARD
jgi:hypothetical protein